MPWTDDPDHTQALGLQKKQLALYDRLAMHLQAKLAAAPGEQAKYAEALAALDNLRGNGPARIALQGGFGTGAKVRYLQGGTPNLTVKNLAGLLVDILAPPKDEAALGRMNP